MISFILLLSFGCEFKGFKTNNEETSSNLIHMSPEYNRNIHNDERVPKGIIDVLAEYNNRYFDMMHTLEYTTYADLFADDLEATLSEYVTKLLIETRKEYDLTVDSGNYDIDIISYKVEGDMHYVEFKEDDYLKFSHLDGIESILKGINCSLVAKKVDGEYKLVSLHKIQDYFVMFTNDDFSTKGKIEVLYNKYRRELNEVSKVDKENKTVALNTPYEPIRDFDYEYDRQAAKDYAYKYWHSRNPEYYDFSNVGGNCQSFASQMAVAGGIPMDIEGDEWQQWKFYGLEVEDKEIRSGRSLSWATVDFFYDYLVANVGDSGMVADFDCNRYYSEPGDIIHVGYDGTPTHTTVVADVYNDYILINSNTLDMLNFPVDAYAYNTKRLIKILGYND